MQGYRRSGGSRLRADLGFESGFESASVSRLLGDLLSREAIKVAVPLSPNHCIASRKKKQTLHRIHRDDILILDLVPHRYKSRWRKPLRSIHRFFHYRSSSDQLDRIIFSELSQRLFIGSISSDQTVMRYDTNAGDSRKKRRNKVSPFRRNTNRFFFDLDATKYELIEET